MKLLLLTGSPHKDGTTSVLADAFEQGARAAGHTVARFDTAELEIGPCRGCDYCRGHGGVCVQKDAMEEIYPRLLEADGVVFVSPLYYFSLSAQLKCALDRFHALSPQLRQSPGKKAWLLCAGGGKAEWTLEGIRSQFGVMCRYLGWENAGMLLALDMPDRQAMERSDYPDRARALGETLL